MFGCCVAAALAVGGDAYFAARDGYLSRPLDYDGVSYVTQARSALALLQSLHLRAALHDVAAAVSPLWISVLTVHQLVLGAGPWQAFSARFWAVALLLVLVFWIVSRRSTTSLAIAAVALIVLVPLVSPAVRASSAEFITGQSNYVEHWYLDDLRPDLLTVVLVLWSVAALAEHARSPRQSAFVASAVFAAAAVLTKASTAPVVLLAWACALGLTWLWGGRSRDVTRMSFFAVLVLVVLLAPWAVFAHGVQTVVTYLRGIVAFQSSYSSGGGLIGGLTYFPARIPDQLGAVEAWVAIAGALFLIVMALRRRLGLGEIVYAGVAVLFYVVFSLPIAKNPVLGLWISLPIWLFFVAGAARVAGTRWQAALRPTPRVALPVAAAYVLVVYALGLYSLAGWPLNEQRSNAQLLAVTTDLAHELGRHVAAGQCFAYAPGPGWPASLTDELLDASGNAPASTAIDVDPSRTTVADYVGAARFCPAILAYREDITEVAKAFFAPSTRQPYLRAVAEFVRAPNSGYTLDRSWSFTDLPPLDPHPLGRYQGVSLTVDLFVRA